ncbi:unannotated protein [freshwater metagenome]|uniref:Unannotated protein n=1 Tax=freshwater metagenome TaxID=449393 RepID=A0A6J6ENA9_9ZZZZ
MLAASDEPEPHEASAVTPAAAPTPANTARREMREERIERASGESALGGSALAMKGSF